jgi:hypothetical protein
MKPHKFEQIAQDHPWLLQYISGWFTPGSDARACVRHLPESHPQWIAAKQRWLKGVVREEIEYIAFRPFDALDLTLRETYPYGSDGVYRASLFSIYFHQGGEVPYSRMQCMPGGDRDIGNFFDYLRVIEGSKAVMSGRAFIYDAVVREDVSVIDATGKGTITIQVYEVPMNCGLNLPAPRSALPPTDPSHTAYIHREPMPPIIPGTTSFAG